MTLSYDDAAARVTAPGERFAIEEIDVRGIPTKVFANAPGSLRQIFDTARGRGDATFLVYEDERWSFDDVMASVDGLAAALAERYGVTKGDRVAIGMRNYPEWVISFAAITSIGAVSVSLNAWWTEDELDYALEDSGAKVLIADVERVERSRSSAARLGFATIGVRLPGGAGPFDATDEWTEVVKPDAVMPEVEIDPEDDATILYTSGTTGRPKGAVSTHRAVTQALTAFGCRAALDRLRKPDGPKPDGAPAFILIVPLFHVTGCVPVMLSCFSSGIKLVIMYKWDPERALELIERERVTNFVGVPTQSWDLLESPSFSTRDTSSLVSVGGGGAPAPPQLVARVDASFAKARPSLGYGMTETNAYGPGNNGDDYVQRPTSTGRVVPVMEIEVRDPEGNAVPAGSPGEIWFKGPNLIRGYWNKPEATAETIVDGWLRTGDLGRLDDEGFVYVEDRAKDMVLRAGENVYCAEVEAAIYEHPAVYEAAVFGVPHERLGEEVAATVFVRPGESLTVEELQAHVRERLAPFKVPSQVKLVGEALPRNPAGKILKRELRDAFPSA
ncbi:MAG TPA: class I adenylate-forming enzyme family protein [Acidimicrobiales bacterium]|nr:class I adenylate-forming enzyme family protein [Acidimicrobiales bacterium]